MPDPIERAVQSVTLRPMTAAEFVNWREHSTRTFTEDLARATGRSADEARQQAASVFDELLPEGSATPNTWLMSILDDQGGGVGTLWVGPHQQRPDTAFVYDIEILPEHRGRGFGRAAMVEAERLASSAGMVEIDLNVFGFNASARQLYESLGYETVAIQMKKRL